MSKETRKHRQSLSRLLATALSVLTVISNFSVSVQAEGSSQWAAGQNVTAELSAEGTLTIAGSGEMAAYTAESPAPWAGSDIRQIAISSGVASVGDYAFYNCADVAGTLVLPDSVLSIGSNAFNGTDGQNPKFSAVISDFKPVIEAAPAAPQATADTTAQEAPAEITAPEEVQSPAPAEASMESVQPEESIAPSEQPASQEPAIEPAAAPAAEPEAQPAQKMSIAADAFAAVTSGVYWCDSSNAEFAAAMEQAGYQPAASREEALAAAGAEPTASAEAETRTISAAVGSQTVTITGPLPEGAQVQAKQIPTEQAAQMLSETGKPADATIVFALDITILADGKEYQPEDYGDSVKVTVSNNAVIAGEELSVTHIKDDGSVEAIPAEETDGKTTFTADSFSTYIGTTESTEPITLLVKDETELLNAASVINDGSYPECRLSLQNSITLHQTITFNRGKTTIIGNGNTIFLGDPGTEGGFSIRAVSTKGGPADEPVLTLGNPDDSTNELVIDARGLEKNAQIVMCSRESGASVEPTLNIYSGVTIQNVDAYFGGAGAGVYVDGICNMYGGIIQNIINTKASVGVGGGVYVAQGTFNMHDGTILNCDVRNGYGFGGGVLVAPSDLSYSSVFNMYGGTIKNNKALYGGGVLLTPSLDGAITVGGSGTGTFGTGNVEFNMSGGSIDGNAAVADANGNCGAGGGVFILPSTDIYCMNKETVFNMSGGAIRNNTASWLGGGVGMHSDQNVTSYGKFNMTGGVIENNSADSYGGGIAVWNNISNKNYLQANIDGRTSNCSITGNSAYYGGGIFNGNGQPHTDIELAMQGSINIQDNSADAYGNNVFLYFINAGISGKISDGSRIGIFPNGYNPFTSGYGTYNSAAPDKYFFSDWDGYYVSPNTESGEAYIAPICTLETGQLFNAAIKKLAAGGTPDYMAWDTSIQSINFYTEGSGPDGVDLASLTTSSVNVDSGNTGSIKAYWDSAKSAIYVVSDGSMAANKSSNYMFYKLGGLTSLDISNLDTSSVDDMGYMFAYCEGLSDLNVGSMDTAAATQMPGLFQGCSGLESIDLSKLKTGNVINMAEMFQNCTSLTGLDLTGFDTSKVNLMNNMFDHCISLSDLKLGSFKTGNVEKMGRMFYGCASLVKLDLSGFDTSNVDNMSGMFGRCTKLAQLNVSSFSTAKVTDMGGMFYGCSSLGELDLSSFDMSNVGTVTGPEMNGTTFLGWNETMLGNTDSLLTIKSPKYLKSIPSDGPVALARPLCDLGDIASPNYLSTQLVTELPTGLEVSHLLTIPSIDMPGDLLIKRTESAFNSESESVYGVKNGDSVTLEAYLDADQIYQEVKKQRDGWSKQMQAGGIPQQAADMAADSVKIDSLNSSIVATLTFPNEISVPSDLTKLTLADRSTDPLYEIDSTATALSGKVLTVAMKLRRDYAGKTVGKLLTDMEALRDVSTLPLMLTIPGLTISGLSEKTAQITGTLSGSLNAVATGQTTSYTLGYSFRGSQAAGGKDAALAADDPTISLTIAPEYTVQFDSNAENTAGTMSNEYFTYNVEQSLMANAYERPGYSFGGWNASRDGKGTPYADGAKTTFIADTTLYAQWEADDDVLSYNANDGVGTMVATAGKVDATVTIADNTFTKAGYHFTGWNTAADGSGTDYQNGNDYVLTAGEDVVYAQWEANQDVSYTVNYLEQDTNKVLATAKTVTGKTFNSEVSEDAAAVTGYTVVGDATQTMTLDAYNKSITFYYTANQDVSYTVNYLEQDTNKVLAPAKTVTDQTFNSKVSEDAAAVTGYTVVGDATQKMKLDAYSKSMTFYYKANEDVSYTVNYLEKDTNAVVSPAKTVTDQTFNSEVSEEAAAVTGYTVVGDATQKMKLDAYGKSMTFYYKANEDVSYTVNYLEKDTNAVLSPAKTVTDQTFNSEVSEDAASVTGYTVVGDATQTMTLDAYSKSMTFYYKVNSAVPTIPGQGRTCQEAGYPAGYYWSEAAKACVIDGVPAQKPGTVPAVPAAPNAPADQNTEDTSNDTAVITPAENPDDGGAEIKPNSDGTVQVEPVENGKTPLSQLELDSKDNSLTFIFTFLSLLGLILLANDKKKRQIHIHELKKFLALRKLGVDPDSIQSDAADQEE